MSSIEALHAEIVADPGATDAYLVLADLLTSRGDPRGELIALECGIARGAKDRMLRVRARKLLDRYIKQLQRDTRAEAEWHLGYVRAGAPADAQSLRALFAHPSACVMTELRIHRQILDDDTTGHESAVHAQLSALCERPRPTLRTLSIRIDYDPEGDAYDARSRLRSQPRELAPFAGMVWAALPNLERLALCGDPIFPALALPALRELVLEGAPLVGGAWQLPQLRALDWTRPHQRVEESWRYGGALRVRRAERQARMLAELWTHPLPALRDLTLRGGVPTGIVLQPQAAARLAELRRLCAPAVALSGPGLDPARLAHLERLVVTELAPEIVPARVRRALKQAVWTTAPSLDRAVSLDAKRLPRG